MSEKFIKRGVEDVAPYELGGKVTFIPILLVKIVYKTGEHSSPPTSLNSK